MNAPNIATPIKKPSSLLLSFLSSYYENPIVIADIPNNETTKKIISTVLNFSPIINADIITVTSGVRLRAAP